VKTLGQQL